MVEHPSVSAVVFELGRSSQSRPNKPMPVHESQSLHIFLEELDITIQDMVDDRSRLASFPGKKY